MKKANINQVLTDQEVDTCSNCGNVYRIELLKEGEDWNDFGYRHCPFCGLVTDEYANMS
jgi:rubredoxin